MYNESNIDMQQKRTHKTDNFWVRTFRRKIICSYVLPFTWKQDMDTEEYWKEGAQTDPMSALFRPISQFPSSVHEFKALE